MLVADTNEFKKFIDNLGLIKNNSLKGKAIKKYCDIFWDLEKRLRKYSDKEYKRCDILLNEEVNKLDKGVDKIEELTLLITYFAKKQIYLHLKGK